LNLNLNLNPSFGITISNPIPVAPASTRQRVHEWAPDPGCQLIHDQAFAHA